jgi:hypothetical protein
MSEWFNGKNAKDKIPNKKGVWYFTYTTECVLCGRGSSYRERHRGRKPKDYLKRCNFKEMACDGHF